MPRTADDSRDIATSVGATAVMVALARAAETASDAEEYTVVGRPPQEDAGPFQNGFVVAIKS